MPTTTETNSRATPTDESDTADALEDVYQSFRSGEATGEEAVATTIHAFTELLRAVLPVAISQPARFVDLSFELAQQAINFERRFLFEMLSGLQRVMTEALSDLENDRELRERNEQKVASRARTSRRAA